jgi:hypothetical protein
MSAAIKANQDLGESLGWPAIKGEYAVVKLEHSAPTNIKETYRNPYPIAEVHKPFVREEVKKWLDAGFIEAVPKELGECWPGVVSLLLVLLFCTSLVSCFVANTYFISLQLCPVVVPYKSMCSAKFHNFLSSGC